MNSLRSLTVVIFLVTVVDHLAQASFSDVSSSDQNSDFSHSSGVAVSPPPSPTPNPQPDRTPTPESTRTQVSTPTLVQTRSMTRSISETLTQTASSSRARTRTETYSGTKPPTTPEPTFVVATTNSPPVGVHTPSPTGATTPTLSPAPPRLTSGPLDATSVPTTLPQTTPPTLSNATTAATWAIVDSSSHKENEVAKERTRTRTAEIDNDATQINSEFAAAPRSAIILGALMTPDEAVAVSSAGTSGAAIGGLTGSPAASGQAIRAGLLMGSTQCAFDSQIDRPPFIEVPFQTTIGSSHNKWFVGSIVLTTFGLLLVPQLLVVLTARLVSGIMKKRSYFKEATDDETTRRARFVLQAVVTLVNSVCMSYICPSMAKWSIFVLLHSDVDLPGGSLSGRIGQIMVALLVLFFSMTLVAFVLYRVHKIHRWVVITQLGGENHGAKNGQLKAVKEEQSDTDSDDGDESELDDHEAARGELAFDFENLERESLIFECYAVYFEATREPNRISIRLVYFAELLAGWLIGVLDGIRPRSGNCLPIAICMTLVCACQLGYLLVIRPYRSRVDTGFSLLGAVILTCIAVVSVFVVLFPTDGAGRQALGLLVLIMMIIFFLQAIAGPSCFCVLLFQRRRKQTEAEEKAFNAKEVLRREQEMSERVTGLEEMGVELADPLLPASAEVASPKLNKPSYIPKKLPPLRTTPEIAAALAKANERNLQKLSTRQPQTADTALSSSDCSDGESDSSPSRPGEEREEEDDDQDTERHSEAILVLSNPLETTEREKRLAENQVRTEKWNSQFQQPPWFENTIGSDGGIVEVNAQPEPGWSQLNLAAPGAPPLKQSSQTSTMSATGFGQSGPPSLAALGFPPLNSSPWSRRRTKHAPVKSEDSSTSDEML